MVAGHLTTALVAKQQAPRGHIAFYLVASQLLDLLWLIFHYLGLEPTQPDNFMAVSVDTLHVDMMYSHDVLPILGWIALTLLVGRAIFGAWRPGWAGGILVALHALTDYVGAYEHHVFGPDTHSVTTGLYYASPYLAVALELAFILAVMAWVVRTDARAGVRRSRATWTVRAAVFGGGVAFMFVTAKQTMAELLGLEPAAAMSGTTVPALAIIYSTMIAALVWGESRPRSSATERTARSDG